jgi:hypothetical protein
VLSSKLADAGQADDDKLLRGWMAVDEMFGGGDVPAATPEGRRTMSSPAVRRWCRGRVGRHFTTIVPFIKGWISQWYA